MISAVDTHILLDILIPDAPAQETSQQLLDTALQQGDLVICEIVHAELAAYFPSVQELTRFLTETGIRILPSEPAALARAGQAWANHMKRRRAGVSCPACGRTQKLFCQHCGATIQARQHLLSDFLVGAHAEIQADRLLTRDRGYYRAYFPKLLLLEPTSKPAG